MTRTEKFFASPAVLLVSGLATAAFQAVLLLMLMRVCSTFDFLEFQLSVHHDSFMVFLDNLGAEKTRLLAWNYVVDFFYPPFYAVFFRCLLTRLAALAPSSIAEKCLALPIAAAICDEIENLCQLPIIQGWISDGSPLFYAGLFASLAKWILIAATLYGVGQGLWILAKERYLEPKRY
jgi:hypothetical protein